ncbi:MAG: sugar phosphate nucleotidyltransferase, partial [Planctomycetota bacterium]
VANPSEFGVVETDDDGNVVSMTEKPTEPKSNRAVCGLYFFDSHVTQVARRLRPGPRGELEMVDLLRHYLDGDTLHVHHLGRGTAWLDTGTPASLLAAAQFVETLQTRQGLLVACPEEIAWNNGWIDTRQLRERINQLAGSKYADYLQSIMHPT